MHFVTSTARLCSSLTLAALCAVLGACDAGAPVPPGVDPGVLPALDRGRDLRGPDANDNGVRDDVEAYIDALPLTDAQRKAAMQTARVQQQSMLIDLADRAAVIALGSASMASTACMADTFAIGSVVSSRELNLKIEAITANTPERARRYIQYMRALSGTSTAYPDGNTCEE